jgi:hypothetical protein
VCVGQPKSEEAFPPMRRIALVIAAGAVSLSAVVVPGALHASAKVPAVCVQHQVGPAHVQVGYCP